MKNMRPLPLTPARFRKIIYSHYQANGRHLPWRRTRDPYRILVSEIMLQQTQVERVRNYYDRFIKRFPNFRALTRASLREVLAIWQGLGYNRRALALKRLAEIVVKDYGGILPRDRRLLEALPGAGPSTAGAVMAFAWSLPSVFLETNVRTVFIHHFFPRRRAVKDTEILPLVKTSLDRRNPREWYFALMDYGAWLKAQGVNASRRSALRRQQPPFKGSNRELRGRIVALLTTRRAATASALVRALGVSKKRLMPVVEELRREGFLKKEARRYAIA